jgi:hypothetical protein
MVFVASLYLVLAPAFLRAPPLVFFFRIFMLVFVICVCHILFIITVFNHPVFKFDFHFFKIKIK